MTVTFRGTRAARALIGVAAIAVAAIAIACGKGGAADDTARAPSSVNIGAENITLVENTELSSGPTLSGQLTAERSASIRAEVSASVVSVLHEQGDHVAAGASIMKLDDSAIRDMWLSARSGVTAAQTAADQAQREVQRAERLHAVGAIADRDLEGAKNGSIAAQAQLADAKARLSAAQKQLDATDVKAPFAGIVAERQASAGDVVAPGAPLFTVIDPASMRLEAVIPASNLADVHIGMRARFTASGYGARSFEGRITNVNPSADPATGQVRIYASIPNTSGQLVAGLYAQGRIAAETRHALSAPLNAIDQRGLKAFVVRLRGGTTEHVEVTLGVRDEERERIEIGGNGIAVGDTLLLGAAQGITPGTKVKVTTPTDAAKKS
jgi:RND family efflux transporter MFP subunit